VSEEPATDDGVIRVVELEEQRLAAIQCPEEAVATRLPEVDLVEVRPARQELVPVLVRDGHEGAHAGILADAVTLPVSAARDDRANKVKEVGAPCAPRGAVQQTRHHGTASTSAVTHSTQ
jgi:hypothetical protein